MTAISAGADYALALKQDGSVWAWGSNGSGRIGDGAPGDGSAATGHSVPFRIQELENVVAVSAGNTLSFAVRSDGTAWGWGGGKQLVSDSYAEAKRRQQEETDKRRAKKEARAAEKAAE